MLEHVESVDARSIGQIKRMERVSDDKFDGRVSKSKVHPRQDESCKEELPTHKISI